MMMGIFHGIKAVTSHRRACSAFASGATPNFDKNLRSSLSSLVAAQHRLDFK